MVGPPSLCDVLQQVGLPLWFFVLPPSLPPFLHPLLWGKEEDGTEAGESHRVVREAALISFTLERPVFTDGRDESLTCSRLKASVFGCDELSAPLQDECLRVPGDTDRMSGCSCILPKALWTPLSSALQSARSLI